MRSGSPSAWLATSVRCARPNASGSLDGIRRRLGHEPTRTTKHVKQLRKLSPPFEHVPPIWQLRIGDHRIFYDVDEANAVVLVRAVRRKPPHTTTEEIL